MEACRLRSHYIEAFFREAFGHLDGALHKGEPDRWQHAEQHAAAGGGEMLFELYCASSCTEWIWMKRRPTCQPGMGTVEYATVRIFATNYTNFTNESV